jgi:hypothetical protein
VIFALLTSERFEGRYRIMCVESGRGESNRVLGSRVSSPFSVENLWDGGG